MAKPWERYQQPPEQPAAGPWGKYEAPQAPNSEAASQRGEPESRAPTLAQELRDSGYLPEALITPATSVENALRAARQGATLGFSDEMVGSRDALSALVTGGDPAEAYRRSRDLERARLRQFEQDAPVASAMGNIGGGLLTAIVPIGAAASAPTFAGRVARSIPAGAATGAVAGLGAGEGSAEEQLKSAGTGAIVGGIAAPVVTGVLGGVSALGRVIPRKAKVGNISGRVAPGVQSAAPQGPPPVDARPRALDLVAETVRRSGATPESIEQQLIRAEQLGAKPEMLVDLLGDQGARRLYSARTLGGPVASEAVERVAARGEGAAARVSDDIQQATAQRGQSLSQLEKRIEGRRQIGSQLYREAYKHGAVTDPDTLALVQNPRVSEILKKASDRRAKVADLRGEKYEPLFRQGEEGAVMARAPTVEDLHLLKTSLDDDIRQAYQAGEGQLGTALRDFKNKIVASLEKEVPAYRKARETYKGDIEIEEAIANGRGDILRKPVDELRRDFAALSEAERDAYRSGAIDAFLARKVDPKVDSADFARSLWGNADSRNRLQILVKSREELERLAAQFEREQRMARTGRGVLGGSQTAMRTADIEDQVAGTLADVATQGPQSAFVGTVGRWIRRAGGVTEEVADDIAKLLTAEGPETMRAVMRTLNERDQFRVATKLAQERAALGVSASGSQQATSNRK